MYENKEILTIIPARIGSKGLPKKNIKPLLGKPLIFWTIETAQDSKYIERIAVSTDDKKIADICTNYGVQVPFLRPEELATDDASIVDVVMHLLDYYDNVENYFPDYVALLQPTSPLRAYYDIDKACEMLFSNNAADAIVSLTEVSESPYWMRTINDNGIINYFINHDYKDFNRQDLPVTYIANGAIYICRTDILISDKTFSPQQTIGYSMPRSRSIDIDDIIDFKLAESILLAGGSQ